MLKTIDGMMLKEMFASGAALVERNRASIDALNVFPVPDGDTGTNMSQTITMAVKELNALGFPTVSEVAGSIAKGALKGARGNSGVILSQILRGFSRALEGADDMNAELFVRALRMGADTAYKAVMKPKEGTILTVARVIAETVERPENATSDLMAIMELVISAGNEILKRTPDMLPALKQAGVVDSGGKGLMTMYAGFLAALKGEPIEEVEAGAVAGRAAGEFVDDHASLEEITFAYCTEFIVSHPRPDMKDSEVAKLRRRLERIGDCALVVGDLEVVKVHVHTNDPGKALQMALELGELDFIKIDNMLEEFRERQAQRRAAQEAEPKEFGIVAVALGPGLNDIFTDLMVDKVVDGGQTMNPSIDDLYQAIEATNARQVFVLPNNTNIILAARQAAELTDKTVYVLPTKSVPMGIAAAIAFMSDRSGEENARIMQEAAERVHTASITYAVRDTTFDNREIHEGDIMALVDNRIALLGQSVDEVAVEVLSTMVTDDTEMISIYHGEDISEEQAAALEARLNEAYGHCDVAVYKGGQPLYYYLIAVE
ncbi:MAG: DAK2 domain-containing protein [Eubacteriales bacterium]|nr:DAK2 domain-containing protein [Christensenellaceae bacterium]MEA5065862.1 DAK2 domain-containing protein [Eubacteriales bacterium]